MCSQNCSSGVLCVIAYLFTQPITESHKEILVSVSIRAALKSDTKETGNEIP